MVETRRFIVMPNFGYRFPNGPLNHNVTTALQVGRSLQVARRPQSATQELVQVVERIGGDGPFLVEANTAGELALKGTFGTLARVVPLHYYPNPNPRVALRDTLMSSAATEPPRSDRPLVLVKTVDAGTGRPVAGVKVLAFTNFRHREGVETESDAEGMAFLDLVPGNKIERLYLFPTAGYWSLALTPTVAQPVTIRLEPIRPDDPRHVVPRLYGDVPASAGQGVTVGVIDTGIDARHPALAAAVGGGRNCVFDETMRDAALASDWTDVDQHGTHVAGIVAARSGVRGVAPAATLRAYRVFPRGGSANSFDVMKAIEVAVRDGCQIVNLSLGQEAPDDAIRGAIGDAIGQGTLVVAAAGNGGRRPVVFPASHDPVVAVGALGFRGTFPASGTERLDVAPPLSTLSPDIFLARFSNTGPQVDFAAPGVGVVSTVPGGGLAAMSGTSMAAPAVAGLAAAFLSLDPALATLAGDARVSVLYQRLIGAAVDLGTGRDAEGFGIPVFDPAAFRKTIAARP